MAKFKYTFTVCLTILLAGCGGVAFLPKPLAQDARGIALVDGTPYNCKTLGEIEGSDEVAGRVGATYNTLRKGAYNDLRNEAVAVAGNGKRITLRILNEVAICGYGDSLYYCDKANLPIHSFRIKAQIFECGEK